MLLYTRLAPPKEPKRRSRAGCTHCKEKKKKCDEKRPECSRCTEHGVSCVYETIKPRKRRKGDLAPSTISTTVDSQPNSRPTYLPEARRLSTASFDSSVYSVAHSTYSADGDRTAFRGRGRLLSMTDFEDPIILSPTVDSNFDRVSLVDFSPVSFEAPSQDNLDPSLKDGEETAPEDKEGHEEGRPNPAVILGYPHQRHGTAGALIIPPRGSSSAAPGTTLHPHLSMIAPSPVASPLVEFHPPAFEEFSDRPNRRALVDHFCNVLSHLIVFREESGNPFQQLVLPLTQKSSPVMNAIYALASAHLEYRGVENQEKSIVFHNRAIQGLARLISLNNKANRNEILAAIMLLVYYEVLVQKGRSNIVHGHLKGALTVMCTNTEPSDATSVFLERAFRFYDVITALSNGTAPLSVAPAPGCLLPFPPLGAPTTSPLSTIDTLLGMATTLWPIIHRLSGLLSLKNELEKEIQANAMSTKIAVLRMESESTAQAIEAALLQWRPHLPPGFVPDEKEMNDPTYIIHNPTSSPPADSDDAVKNNVDGRDQPTPTADTTSGRPILTINTDLPTPAHIAMTPKERGRIHSILHNALAYRHSALVYLYRTIYAHRRSHPAVQTHAHLSLMHCVATVCHAGPMGALLWPLFVAACEAVSPEDRELAKRAFTATRKRQGMMNIERAWDIVQEVWRRADTIEEELDKFDDKVKGETEKSVVADGLAAAALGGPTSSHVSPAPAELWRQVSVDMGVNIVFG
ncbi:Fungal specific transcription factor domain containing protein [Naviculisporaceae sp. PSN 640]